MRIGQVAGRAGLATSAVRFYEQEGLIPEPARTHAGYRDYDSSVVGRLEFIRAGQAVGLTLEELREVLGIRDRGETPCRHVAELLDARIAAVDQRIEELRGLRRQLVSMSDRATSLDPADCPPESFCRIIAPAE